MPGSQHFNTNVVEELKGQVRGIQMDAGDERWISVEGLAAKRVLKAHATYMEPASLERLVLDGGRCCGMAEDVRRAVDALVGIPCCTACSGGNCFGGIVA